MVAFLLKDVFTSASTLLAFNHDKANSSDTETNADGINSFNLEYKDNPFTSFLRKLENLIEENPKEAYLLLQMALNDKIFASEKELDILGKKLDKVVETLQIEKTGEPLISAKNSFIKSVYGLPDFKPEKDENLTPSYTPSYERKFL